MRITPSPRSLLFFPGTRPDRHAKALASGADLVCLDLEDAVGPDDKDTARDHAVHLVEGGGWTPSRSIVRINHPGSDEGVADLDVLLAAARSGAHGSHPFTLMVPKVDGPAELEVVRQKARSGDVDVRFMAMIETARGLAEVERIARVDDVVALLFGGVDLSAELGCALAWEPLLHARSRIVLAAALGRIDALDVPFLDLRDAAALRSEASAVRRLGFTGKAAVHPDQIAPIHEAFAPTPEEVAHARHVLEALSERSEGVFLVDGTMVDRPVVEAARRTLARAGVGEQRSGPSAEPHTDQPEPNHR